jgi:hypothetical protein
MSLEALSTVLKLDNITPEISLLPLSRLSRRNREDVRRLHLHSLMEIVMPEPRHEMEAERILALLSTAMPDEQALLQSRRLLAEALESAEKRGRQISGHRKESSG